MAEPSAQKLAREMSHKHGKVDQSARDNPLTGSAMQALARGWLAGTIGIPGDLEGLGRMGLNALGAGVDKHAALPTTDFFKEWLPGKQTGDENVATVGSMLGGAGVGTARQAVRNAAKAAPGALTQMARNAAMPRQLSAQAGVIKAPGGNWLTGSVEDALKGLKRGEHENEAVRAIRAVRPELSVEDARAFIQAVPVDPKDTALNAFIDKQLTRYVKNDMATERDPIRALAERGTLHVNPEQLNFQIPMHGKYLEEGQTAVAKSDAAKAWEGSSDMQIAKMKAGELLKGDGWFPDTAAIRNAAERNPWLATKPEGTEVIAVRERMMPQDLGFDHLIDELRNATNPASGLPRELLLKPESLDRVSVPQAVEHVAKINAWREAQKVAANEAIANNAATHVFKEYTENNPKGLKWVELKAEKDANPAYLGEGKYEDAKMQALKDALKYEGDTMGHCVGGYCDDVASGKSLIYSLRDAKGQPHVTVEARPSDWYEQMKNRSLEDSKLFNAQFKAKLAESGLDPKGRGPEATNLGNAVYAELFGSAPEPSIIQIKGKANRKPNDEYLPFVQDFVRSGKWSDVGDLQNSGLVPYTRGKQHVPRGLTGRTTMGVPFDEVGIPEGYYAEDELLNLMRQWQERSGNKPNFAAGGAVPTDAEIQQFYAAHKDDPAALKAAMQQYGVDTAAVNAALGQDAAAELQQRLATVPDVTFDQFSTKVQPSMLDESGRFRGPQSGVNYAFEGLTPQQAYEQTVARHRAAQTTDGYGQGNADRDPALAGSLQDALNPAWREGVVSTNKGGLLGNWGVPLAMLAAPFAAAAAGVGSAAGATAASTGSAGAASGLAGKLGMDAGLAANALNSGALSTGMNLARGQNFGEALRGGLASAAMSPVGGWAGNAATGALSNSGLSPATIKALGGIASNTATGGASAALRGQNVGKGLTSGFANGLVGAAGNYVGGLTRASTNSELAGNAASALAQGALRGKPLSIDALATQYATGKLTDLSGLDPSVAGIVVNLAKNKRPSVVGALSTMANVAGRRKTGARPVGS